MDSLRFSEWRLLVVMVIFLFSQPVAATLNCGCLSETELVVGSMGEDVRGVQELLKEQGLFPGEVTGFFDEITGRAVERFQIQNKLMVSGKIDANTWNYIGSIQSSAPVSSPPPAGEVSLVIDIHYRLLTVMANGAPFKSFPIAVGKLETPTPVGEWEIVKKGVWSGGFGTRWLGLSVPYGIFGIHGTNKPWSIGRMESHGCIRMLNRDVEQVYRWVVKGTRVSVIGDPFMGRRRLTRGERGCDVWFLQKRLRQLGLYQGQPDGIFGYGTEQAVKVFQKQTGLLPVTGQVDWREYKALRLLPEE